MLVPKNLYRHFLSSDWPAENKIRPKGGFLCPLRSLHPAGKGILYKRIIES